MKRNLWLLSATAFLIIPIVTSSCTTSSQLTAAATQKGKINAGIHLPNLPSDCRVMEPHAAIEAGDEARSILVNERGALNRANTRVGRCAGFYDGVKRAFGP